MAFSIARMVVIVKILHISMTDRIGGAGIAAYRLHQGLRQTGIDSQMLVMRKVSSDPNVHRLSDHLHRLSRIRRRVAVYRHKRHLQRTPRTSDSAYWSLNHQPYPIANAINNFNADIVHLHWVGDNYLPVDEFRKINAPIVWTLHDMWAFTGGCHYAGDCTEYRQNCGNCPQLSHPAPDDLSYRIMQHKIPAWKNLPMTIVCPSGWLADCASDSLLLGWKDRHVIHNGIDTTQFKPIDTISARTAFNLPQDKKLVLFGAFGGTSDPRKGFDYLREALTQIRTDTDIELVVFGSEQPQDLGVNLPVHQVGRLQDNVSMAVLYSACDVFVLPSLQDNLPNTILESLACGTPCVVFDAGGMRDLIQHQTNGYLATLRDTDDLANGMTWVLSQPPNPDVIHQDIVRRFALPHIAEQYRQLYTTINNAEAH